MERLGVAVGIYGVVAVGDDVDVELAVLVEECGQDVQLGIIVEVFVGLGCPVKIYPRHRHGDVAS